jgi:hypothetical protein
MTPVKDGRNRRLGHGKHAVAARGSDAMVRVRDPEAHISNAHNAARRVRSRMRRAQASSDVQLDVVSRHIRRVRGSKSRAALDLKRQFALIEDRRFTNADIKAIVPIVQHARTSAPERYQRDLAIYKRKGGRKPVLTDYIGKPSIDNMMKHGTGVVDRKVAATRRHKKQLEIDRKSKDGWSRPRPEVRIAEDEGSSSAPSNRDMHSTSGNIHGFREDVPAGRKLTTRQRVLREKTQQGAPFLGAQSAAAKTVRRAPVRDLTADGDVEANPGPGDRTPSDGSSLSRRSEPDRATKASKNAARRANKRATGGAAVIQAISAQITDANDRAAGAIDAARELIAEKEQKDIARAQRKRETEERMLAKRLAAIDLAHRTSGKRLKWNSFRSKWLSVYDNANISGVVLVSALIVSWLMVVPTLTLIFLVSPYFCFLLAVPMGLLCIFLVWWFWVRFAADEHEVYFIYSPPVYVDVDSEQPLYEDRRRDAFSHVDLRYDAHYATMVHRHRGFGTFLCGAWCENRTSVSLEMLAHLYYPSSSVDFSVLSKMESAATRLATINIDRSRLESVVSNTVKAISFIWVAALYEDRVYHRSTGFQQGAVPGLAPLRTS